MKAHPGWSLADGRTTRGLHGGHRLAGQHALIALELAVEQAQVRRDQSPMRSARHHPGPDPNVDPAIGRLADLGLVTDLAVSAATPAPPGTR